MKDLYVTDLSVCDELISKGLLSDDDWTVLNKTKRNKSKVKRLISILCKTKNPKAAFYALSECTKTTHSHLTECIRQAAERIPSADINSNINVSGEKCDETVFQSGSDVSSQNFHQNRREAVEHYENVDNSNTQCELSNLNSKTVTEFNVFSQTCVKNQNEGCINTDKSDRFPVESSTNFTCDNNHTNISLLGDETLHFQEEITKTPVEGIETVTNDSLTPDILPLDTAHSNSNVDNNCVVINKGQKIQNSGQKQDNACVENGNLPPDASNGSSVVSDSKFPATFGFDDVDGFLPDSHIKEANINLLDGAMGFSNNLVDRKNAKRLKHLRPHPNDSDLLGRTVEKKTERDGRNADNTFADEDGKNHKKLWSKSQSEQFTSRFDDTTNDKSASVHNAYQSSQYNTCSEIRQTLQTESPSIAESQSLVTYRQKVQIGIGSEWLQMSDGISRTTKDANLPLKSPRAFSQIDYCSASLMDKYINRIHSWAGARTKSHIYDDFTSSSEDYTTTDVSYSDLNDIERELRDTLEKSGAITDLVDCLIQEEYFSNDDWCAVNEIQVTGHQATYVAKRLSNKIRSDGCQSFTDLLKRQPRLKDWLSSKFESHINDGVIDKAGRNCVILYEQNEGRNSDTDSSDVSNPLPRTEIDTGDCSCTNSRKKCLDVAIFCQDRVKKKSCFSPSVLCPGEIVVDKHFQNVFDTLNTEFNNGALPVTKLPSDPNVKCIVLYLKACDALYKAQDEDAERYIKLAEAAINDSECPLFMRSEIFTQKTWLCLRTNRLGQMKKLLEENEQFLLANPNLWSNKAVGWFYFDYGRFNVRMMTVTKPTRIERRRNGKDKFSGAKFCSRTAYDIYQEKAKKCLRKSIDYFAHSDSSDGPIGMGFSLSLLASIELQCVTEHSFLNKSVGDSNISEAEKLLQTVEKLYDEIPDVLKASYLISKADLCFRKNKLPAAKEHVEECAALSEELSLDETVKESEIKRRLLSHFA